MENATHLFDEIFTKRVTTAFFTIIYSTVIVTVGLMAGDNKIDKAINILIFTLGAVVGWLVAIVISPYDPNEKDVFIKVGQTISAFITGYFLSKLDKPIQAYIDVFTKKIQDGTTSIVVSNLNKVRIIGLIISFIISSITVYVQRSDEYSAEVVKQNKTLTTAKAKADSLTVKTKKDSLIAKAKKDSLAIKDKKKIN